MRIVAAQPQDVSKLLAFREEAAAWLSRLGSDQWQRPYPADKLLETIEAGTVFMVKDGNTTAGTITLTREAEAGLWTDEELTEPSLFINKLTVARTHAGQNVGGRLLDWAGDRAYRAGVSGSAWTPGPRIRVCRSTTFVWDSSMFGQSSKGSRSTAAHGSQGGSLNAQHDRRSTDSRTKPQLRAPWPDGTF